MSRKLNTTPRTLALASSFSIIIRARRVAAGQSDSMLRAVN